MFAEPDQSLCLSAGKEGPNDSDRKGSYQTCRIPKLSVSLLVTSLVLFVLPYMCFSYRFIAINYRSSVVTVTDDFDISGVEIGM